MAAGYVPEDKRTTNVPARPQSGNPKTVATGSKRPPHTGALGPARMPKSTRLGKTTKH